MSSTRLLKNRSPSIRLLMCQFHSHHSNSCQNVALYSIPRLFLLLALAHHPNVPVGLVLALRQLKNTMLTQNNCFHLLHQNDCVRSIFPSLDLKSHSAMRSTISPRPQLTNLLIFLHHITAPPNLKLLSKSLRQGRVVRTIPLFTLA